MVRDRPVAGPTRIPRRVYRSEEEDYYSARQVTSPYKLDDRYSREYGGYEVSDDEFTMRTYAPSASGVAADVDDEEPEYAAPEEPEQAGPPSFDKKFQDMSIRDGERVVLEVSRLPVSLMLLFFKEILKIYSLKCEVFLTREIIFFFFSFSLCRIIGLYIFERRITRKMTMSITMTLVFLMTLI